MSQLKRDIALALSMAAGFAATAAPGPYFERQTEALLVWLDASGWEIRRKEASQPIERDGGTNNG